MGKHYIERTGRSNLAKNLKLLRMKHKYTQGEIAKRLNISRSAYTYYEMGNTEPSINSIEILSRIYGVKIEDLLQSYEILKEKLGINNSKAGKS